MSVTVGVVAKKAVEVLASNSKGRKFIGYTIGIVIFLLFLPVIVIFGLFGFMGNGDAFQLDKTQIMAALPAEGQAQIQQIDTACNSLASKFTDNGFSENDIEKAEFIYLGSFIGKEKDKNFYDNFIWCFNNATRFRDMLRTQTETLSANLKIPMDNLKWFAAYHNESYHPHVHLIAYSVVENEGYLTKQGVQNIRASLAKDIFAQDNLGIYKKQTAYRDVLREDSKNIVADIIDSINLQGYGNAKIEELLLKLADKLSKTSGKKVYGYLKSDVKNIIDSIVDELASDIRIAKLYDLWYEQKYAVLKNYTDTIPLKIPLSKNKEFKSIKNAVINEALNINLDSIISEDENFKITISKPEPTNAVKETEKAIALPKSSAGQYNIFEKNLQKSYSHKNSNVGMGVFRLFNHLSRIIQNKLEEDKHGKIGILDRKLKSEIDEKKQAHGLRLE
ncbi:MAG: MobP3 family relaxase [Oscillospiraceae bacterium]